MPMPKAMLAMMKSHGKEEKGEGAKGSRMNALKAAAKAKVAKRGGKC